MPNFECHWLADFDDFYFSPALNGTPFMTSLFIPAHIFQHTTVNNVFQLTKAMRVETKSGEVFDLIQFFNLRLQGEA